MRRHSWIYIQSTSCYCQVTRGTGFGTLQCASELFVRFSENIVRLPEGLVLELNINNVVPQLFLDFQRLSIRNVVSDPGHA